MSTHEMRAMSAKEFRSLVRQGDWTDQTIGVCQGYAQANLAIVPKEYAFEFLLFCYRNPRPCPVLDVTQAGDPHPNLMAPDADLRTDLPKYRVFKDGEVIAEPTDIIDYWQDNLVAFLLGCSLSFDWILEAANVHYRFLGAYITNIPCIPVGCFSGPLVVSGRAFQSAHDAVRAVQISSRHLMMHGPPVHIGDPAEIGIKDLYEPYGFIVRGPIAPLKPSEITMFWACGVTPSQVAVKAKLPIMITHVDGHLFITDHLSEELAII